MEWKDRIASWAVTILIICATIQLLHERNYGWSLLAMALAIISSNPESLKKLILRPWKGVGVEAQWGAPRKKIVGGEPKPKVEGDN